MKIVRFTFAFLIIGFMLMSCEGPKKYNVTVVDKITKQPLESVLVKVKVMSGKSEKKGYNLEGYTDATGQFVKDEMIGYGLSMKRCDFYMAYHKKGYVQKTEVNHTEGQVELERW